MRSKEEAHDYRYFPEPDLPPLESTPAWVDEIRGALPELPEARRRRFVDAVRAPGVRCRRADAVARRSPTTSRRRRRSRQPQGGEQLGDGRADAQDERARRRRSARSPLTPAALAGLIRLVDSGTISGPIAKDVFEKMYDSGRAADEIVAAEGLARIDDAGAIEAQIADVMRANDEGRSRSIARASSRPSAFWSGR